MEEVKKRVGAGCGTMLLRDGKVLLGKRHGDPEKASSELHGAGTWTCPGGKFDFGDSLTGAPVREVLEETGITINPADLQIVSVSSDHIPEAHFITIGFLCTKFDSEPRIMEPDEITEWQWFPLDALPEPMYFPSAKMIQNYLDKKLFQQ